MGKIRGLFLVIFDTVIVQIAFVFWYSAKSVPAYPKISLPLTLLWLYLLGQKGSYDNDLPNAGTPMPTSDAVITSGIYAMSLLMIISFLFGEVMILSVPAYLMSGISACVGMLAIRLFVLPRIHSFLANRGYFFHNMAILDSGGTDGGINDRFANIVARTKFGIRIVGVIAEKEPEDSGFAYLGNIGEIGRIHAQTGFDTLMMANPENASVCEIGNDTLSFMRVVNFCEKNDIRLYLFSGIRNIEIMPDEVGCFGGCPIIRLRDARPNPAYGVIKRIFDVSAALLILISGIPLWLCIAILIKAEGKGPVFFTQTRAGLNGRPFRMYKFRSMIPDAEDRLKELIDIDKLDEPVFKIRNDPRVTPVGRFIRQTGLDEIPQLLNVLKGEMSLVGPRPEELRIVEKYDDHQQRRLKAKPGITGYQQIMNRGEPILSKRIGYDLTYLKNRSFLLDIHILFRTIFVVLSGRGNTH